MTETTSIEKIIKILEILERLLTSCDKTLMKAFTRFSHFTWKAVRINNFLLSIVVCLATLSYFLIKEDVWSTIIWTLLSLVYVTMGCLADLKWRRDVAKDAEWLNPLHGKFQWSRICLAIALPFFVVGEIFSEEVFVMRVLLTSALIILYLLSYTPLSPKLDRT